MKTAEVDGGCGSEGQALAGETGRVISNSMVASVLAFSTPLHRNLPTAMLLVRLQRQGDGWYGVPSMSAAIHLWWRRGVRVLEGGFVRIERGVVTMKGYADKDLQACDF